MISEATNKHFIEELLEKLTLGSEHTPRILEKLFNQLMLAERETVLGQLNTSEQKIVTDLKIENIFQRWARLPLTFVR